MKMCQIIRLYFVWTSFCGNELHTLLFYLREQLSETASRDQYKYVFTILCASCTWAGTS